MAKKMDLKAKAKRQKIFAAIGGVILLAVLAFQVPRTLKMLHQSNASAASSTPAASTTTTPTATGATGASAVSSGNAATASDGVSDPGVLPAPNSGQLLAFSRFQSKDPFAQQLQTGPTGAGGATGGGKTGASGSGSTGTTGSGSTGSGSGSSTPPAHPTAATISVNGVGQTVRVGKEFPASNPTFVLVSLTRTSARDGIAGGSISGGQQTVTLKKGATLTLMNTADGTRYALKLVSVS
jgi:hypothetical protein